MIFGFWLLVSCIFISGCGPKFTYPAGKVPKAVEDICKKEFSLDVEARVVGKTLGALLVVDGLFDSSAQIPKEVHESMGKVLQALTRVALATDLPVDFNVVVIRDRKQGNELTITRSLDDARRADAYIIGVEESLNRTLFGQGHYTVEPNKQAPFILKEIKIENFLADQIVQRIRFNFSKETKEAKDAASNPFILADGGYQVVKEQRILRFSVIGLKADEPRANILSIFKIVNDVLYGYSFKDFDQIEIQDYLNRQKLVIDRQTLLDFQQKKIKDAELLDRFLTESQSIQEAFKLFGFSLPADSGE